MNKKIDLERDEWIYLLYALDGHLGLFGALPEPMRSREAAPFVAIREKIVSLLAPEQK